MLGQRFKGSTRKRNVLSHQNFKATASQPVRTEGVKPQRRGSLVQNHRSGKAGSVRGTFQTEWLLLRHHAERHHALIESKSDGL